MDAQRGLRISALVYGSGLLFHTADHIRRGAGVLSTPVQILGAVSTLLGFLMVFLVLKRNPTAPRVAAVFAPLAAAGIVTAHLLPRWSSLSLTFIDARGTGVAPTSWISVLIEIAGALAVAVFSGLVISRDKVRAGTARPLLGPGR